MKKRTAILITLLLISSAAMALPPVWLNPACSKLDPIDSKGEWLIGIISPLLGGTPVTYDTVDLNNDGIPDSYQLGMLAEVLCNGTWVTENNVNLGLYDALAGDLADVWFMFEGDGVRPQLDVRLNHIADIFASVIPQLPPDQQNLVSDLVIQIQGLAAQMTEYLNYVQQYKSLVAGVVLPALPGLRDLGAALVGIDDFAVVAFEGFIAPYTSHINNYIAFGQQSVAAAQSIMPLLSSTDQAYMQDAIADVTLLMQDVQWGITTLPASVAIYGSAKAGANPPLSGGGDYNGDGVTNLQVFNILKNNNHGNPPARADYVAAASGYNEFFQGNPALPVAGLVGLAVLAGALGLGGTRALRKK